MGKEAPKVSAAAGPGAATTRSKPPKPPKFDDFHKSAKIGWIHKTALDFTEATAPLNFSRTLVDEIKFARDHPSKIDLTGIPQKYYYVLVPGTFADHVPFYFNNVKHRLRELKLRCIKLKLKSEATVRSNSQRIYAALSSQFNSLDAKFIFICHSKGGLDLLRAVAKYPDLKQRTAMSIMFYSPMGGCIVAEHVVHSRKNIYGSLYQTFLPNADRKCLKNMTYRDRRKFFKANPMDSIGIPTFCLAARMTSSDYSIYRPFRKLCRKRYKEDMDGLVTIKDAILPDQPYAIIDKCNHSSVVWDKMTSSKFTSSDIVVGALQVVFNNNLMKMDKPTPLVFESTQRKNGDSVLREVDATPRKK